MATWIDGLINDRNERPIAFDLEFIGVKGVPRTATVEVPDPARFPQPKGVILNFHGFR